MSVIFCQCEAKHSYHRKVRAVRVMRLCKSSTPIAVSRRFFGSSAGSIISDEGVCATEISLPPLV